MRVGLKNFLFLFYAFHQATAFLQKDWHAIHERAFLYYSNPKFINNVMFEFRFFNRTTKTYYAQFELIEDGDDDLELRLDCYKLYSNEYRGFPITITFNLCRELDVATFGYSDLKKYSNITNCPWKKGLYVVKDFAPDESKLPPFIPHGRYKLILKIFHHSDLVFEGHIYNEIKGIKKVGNSTVYV